MKSFLTILFAALAIVAAPLAASAVVLDTHYAYLPFEPITVPGDAEGGKGYDPLTPTDGGTAGVCSVISWVDYLKEAGTQGSGFHGMNIVAGEALEKAFADPDFQNWAAKYGIVLPEGSDKLTILYYFDSDQAPADDGVLMQHVYFVTADGCTGYWDGYMGVDVIAAMLDHDAADVPPDTAQKPSE